MATIGGGCTFWILDLWHAVRQKVKPLVRHLSSTRSKQHNQRSAVDTHTITLLDRWHPTKARHILVVRRHWYMSLWPTHLSPLSAYPCLSVYWYIFKPIHAVSPNCEQSFPTHCMHLTRLLPWQRSSDTNQDIGTYCKMTPSATQSQHAPTPAPSANLALTTMPHPPHPNFCPERVPFWLPGKGRCS